MRKIVVAAFMLALLGAGILMLFVTAKMPRMGDSGAPDKTYAIPRYISRGLQEAGEKSVPNDVALNYRAFDAMAGAAALFTAFCAVLSLLGRSTGEREHTSIDLSGVRSGVMPRTVARLLVPLTILFAGFVTLVGIDTFGYSLQTSTVIGGAIILLALVFSTLESRRRLGAGASTFLEGLALLAFLAVGLLGVFLSDNFLTFSLHALHGRAAQVARASMMSALDIGIAVATAVIITNVVFSLMRQEER